MGTLNDPVSSTILSYDSTSGYMRFVAHSTASCLRSWLGSPGSRFSPRRSVKMSLGKIAVRPSLPRPRMRIWRIARWISRSSQPVPSPKPTDVNGVCPFDVNRVLISYSSDCIAS